MQPCAAGRSFRRRVSTRTRWHGIRSLSVARVWRGRCGSYFDCTRRRSCKFTPRAADVTHSRRDDTRPIGLDLRPPRPIGCAPVGMHAAGPRATKRVGLFNYCLSGARGSPGSVESAAPLRGAAARRRRAQSPRIESPPPPGDSFSERVRERSRGVRGWGVQGGGGGGGSGGQGVRAGGRATATPSAREARLLPRVHWNATR